MMEKAQTILATISKLYDNEKQVEVERREKGEFFNVFNTIGLRTEEVRLHSAFIAELLNPKGSHGLSYHFLQAFLEIINLPKNYIDYHRCSQNIVERVIGRVTTDTEGGRIDIIIEDGNHAVIIENKIYACDQTNQMLRYNNYGRKNFPNGYELVYLTLDGHGPDDCSLGNDDYPFIASYEKDIVKWLEKCYSISERKPLVQSVIKQYCELVKQITNTDMDTKYRNNLMSVMLAPENVIAVGEMLQLRDDWLNEIIDSYIWHPLEEYAKSKGMEFGISWEEGRAWIHRKEWKCYGIFIKTDRKDDWNKMYIGISWYKEPNRKNKIYKKDYRHLNCLTCQPCDGWPYGWEYLPDELRNWEHDITEKIVKGEVFDCIKKKFEEILSEIEELQLPMP